MTAGTSAPVNSPAWDVHEMTMSVAALNVFIEDAMQVATKYADHNSVAVGAPVMIDCLKQQVRRVAKLPSAQHTDLPRPPAVSAPPAWSAQALDGLFSKEDDGSLAARLREVYQELLPDVQAARRAELCLPSNESADEEADGSEEDEEEDDEEEGDYEGGAEEGESDAEEGEDSSGSSGPPECGEEAAKTKCTCEMCGSVNGASSTWDSWNPQDNLGQIVKRALNKTTDKFLGR
jgi:hypothetical protein